MSSTVFAFEREQIRIVGSSTVFPFSALIAENFSKMTPYPSPIVEINGTGGGIHQFCSGIGAFYPDIVNASRTMKESEKKYCLENGVHNISEIKIGTDGITLVSDKSNKMTSLSLRELWFALSKYVPQNNRLILNPYKKWSDINPSLPPYPIEILGPPPSSGTREAFVELVMSKGCPDLSNAIDDPLHLKFYCTQTREDGAYVDIGENDNVTIQKLTIKKEALGIIRYSFYDRNTNLIKATRINGYLPTQESILQKQYPLSRPLFLYVKKDHYTLIPGLEKYVKTYIYEMIEPAPNLLSRKGLIPLTADEGKALKLQEGIQ